MAHWRIDSWDGRGGIAFASWRDFSLMDEQTELREAPNVMIGAPFFRPEPMATRALGRFATRGVFQTGVFAGESEVSFISLEAIIDIVRRTYLRFGGADGMEGGGTTTPPTPEGGGSGLAPLPLSPLDLFGSDPSAPDEGPRTGRATGPNGGLDDRGARGPIDIIGLLQFFDQSSKDQPESAAVSGVPIRSHLVQPGGHLQPPTIGLLRRPENILGWATLVLMREMLRRLPPAASLADRFRWHEEASTLGHMIARLGLWDWLFSHPVRHILDSWIASIRKSAGGSLQYELEMIARFPISDARTQVAFGLLFGVAPAIDHAYWIHWLQTNWERSGGPTGRLLQSLALARIRLENPLEALRLIPLPAQLITIISSESRSDANLYHLLAAATASPLELLKNKTDGVSVLLFAACQMVLDEAETAGSFRVFGSPKTSLSPLQAHWLGEVLGRAWNWLAQSLPSLIFPEYIEQMIADVTSLHYGDDWTGRGLRPDPGRVETNAVAANKGQAA